MEDLGSDGGRHKKGVADQDHVQGEAEGKKGPGTGKIKVLWGEVGPP